MTTALRATAIKHKDMRQVVAAAIERGWELTRRGNDHFALGINGSNGEWHVQTISCSPSDTNAHRQVERKLAQCVEGRCGHGGMAQETLGDDARRAAAKERADRQLAEAKLRAETMTKTHTPIIGVNKEPKVTTTKPKRKAKRPGYEKALKWTRWYVSERQRLTLHDTPIAQPKLEAKAKEAGISWTHVREALLANGLGVLDYRGRNGSWWTFPIAEEPATPTTKAGDGSSTRSITPVPRREEGQATVHASSPVLSGEGVLALAELARERGRMEGMCMAADIMLGNGTLMQDQLKKLMEVIAHGE